LCIIWGQQEELSSTAVCPRTEGVYSVNDQGRMRELSTPEQNCISLPEQKYINDAGKKAPNWGPFVLHQAWVGLSPGVSELARREWRLL
jgi:hypothetical protein